MACIGVATLLTGGFGAAALADTTSAAANETAEIAKQLNNPIAALISVPFQLNYAKDLGPTKEGESYVLNVQPVIPIHLNADWNLISRTIVPVIQLEDVPPGNDESGVGDVLQSLFFSPSALVDGWTWGVGPALAPRNGRRARLRSPSSRNTGGPTACWRIICGRTRAMATTLMSMRRFCNPFWYTPLPPTRVSP